MRGESRYGVDKCCPNIPGCLDLASPPGDFHHTTLFPGGGHPTRLPH